MLYVYFVDRSTRELYKNYCKFLGFEYYLHFCNIHLHLRPLIFPTYCQNRHIFSILFVEFPTYCRNEGMNKIETLCWFWLKVKKINARLEWLTKCTKIVKRRIKKKKKKYAEFGHTLQKLTISVEDKLCENTNNT